MKSVVADTSALISLGYSGRLEMVCDVFAAHIPIAVQTELEEISSYSDKLSKMAKEVLGLVRQGKIRCHEKVSQTGVAQLIGKEVDYGEAACFQLAIEQNISVVLLDDIDAAYEIMGLARAKNISLRISASAVVELFHQGRINKSEMRKSLNDMIQHRNWEKSALESLIQKIIE